MLQTPGPQETDPLLGQEHVNGDFEPQDTDSTRAGFYDERRAQELNQKVADIVTNGTGRMLTPVLLRGGAVYSPVLPTASSSQANLPAPSVSRQPPPQPLGAAAQQQQQRESRHSSQSSRHSSYKQHHPSLVPHVEGRRSEDAVSALDAAANQSLTAGVGNTSQTNINLGYGATGLGASATGRRFQIHRGRPPSRTKPAENGVGTAVYTTQTNGVSIAGEAGDEPKQRSTSSSARPPTSPPRAIISPKSEEESAERRQVHFKLPPGDLILQYDD